MDSLVLVTGSDLARLVAGCYHALMLGDEAKPSFSLAEIQAKVEAGFFVVTEKALLGVAELGFDRSDLEECITHLDEADFYKTMAAKKRIGLMQDVYRCMHLDASVYIKLQLSRAGRVVVISFKRDQSR